MNIDQIHAELTGWVRSDVEPSYPRGLGACLWVSSAVQARWGLTAIEGIFVDDPDDLAGEIDAGHVYTHAWNHTADGTIVDGTAGQFHRDGPVAQVIAPGDDLHRRYLTWEQIPVGLHDAVDEAVQGSYPDP